MILYRLRCSKGHEFEGWFKDSKTYERQEKKSLVGCAVCGDAKVTRAPMAPRLGKRGKSEPVEVTANAAPVPSSAEQQQIAALAQKMPRELREALLKSRGNRTKAAQLMGVSRRTLHRKIAQWPELDVTDK